MSKYSFELKLKVVKECLSGEYGCVKLVLNRNNTPMSEVKRYNNSVIYV